MNPYCKTLKEDFLDPHILKRDKILNKLMSENINKRGQKTDRNTSNSYVDTLNYESLLEFHIHTSKYLEKETY